MVPSRAVGRRGHGWSRRSGNRRDRRSPADAATVRRSRVTRFIENRFDLPALTDRDANAWPMLDMFDFASPPFMTPPAGAPAAVIDAAKQQWCLTNPPGTGKP